MGAVSQLDIAMREAERGAIASFHYLLDNGWAVEQAKKEIREHCCLTRVLKFIELYK